MIAGADLARLGGGVLVGHATDRGQRTGVTTIVFPEPVVAGVAVRGGAPGTRETDALTPGGLGPPVDAICLSGGSAFGLAAADGVQRALAEKGRGFAVGRFRVPIVPAAIVFDLGALGEGPLPDYAALGAASVAAATDAPEEGTVGAGTGATTATVKGGVGVAVEAAAGEASVAALAVVNAVGAVTAANGPWLRAAPFERDGEFGQPPTPADADWTTLTTKLGRVRANTTIAVVVTNATLSGAEATRLASIAHDGLALAIYPAHTLYDGDTVFAAATNVRPAPKPSEAPEMAIALAAAATRALARAVARAVVFASAADGDTVPAWRTLADHWR